MLRGPPFSIDLEEDEEADDEVFPLLHLKLLRTPLAPDIFPGLHAKRRQRQTPEALSLVSQEWGASRAQRARTAKSPGISRLFYCRESAPLRTGFPKSEEEAEEVSCA